MKIKEIPSNIGEYLKYDETSPSCLRWVKARHHINVGDHAGTLHNRRNYYLTGFAGKLYQNHRIIFFLNFGYCPEIIDHIDGNPQNNRIDNLRESTRSQNNCNSRINSNNSSGYKGISLHSSGKYQYWRVQIKKNNKLGISKTFPLSQFQQACNFADEQRAILHGEFANNGGEN